LIDAHLEAAARSEQRVGMLLELPDRGFLGDPAAADQKRINACAVIYLPATYKWLGDIGFPLALFYANKTEI
jgi:hypothetical protein